MLLIRKYNINVVKEATKRALGLNRTDVLKKVDKTKKDRVVLALTYHSKLPCISSIVTKHWRKLCKDPNAKQTFPLPPMVAFKQPTNLRNTLCQAKLPKTTKHLNTLEDSNRHKTVQQTMQHLSIRTAIKRVYINNNKSKVCNKRDIHMHNKRHNIPHNLL
jgi:hypothetical protein